MEKLKPAPPVKTFEEPWLLRLNDVDAEDALVRGLYCEKRRVDSVGDDMGDDDCAS